MYYYGLRYLSTTWGRWLNEDPIEEQGGLNLYAVVENEPVGRIDKLGLLTLDEAYSSAVSNRPAGCHAKLTAGLMLCLLWKESSFDENAKSSTSTAFGIAQILDGTADDIQDRVAPKRFSSSSNPFYTLSQGERLRDHRANPDVSIYAAYLYLHDRVLAKGGNWREGVKAYGPRGDKVITCSRCCAIAKLEGLWAISDSDEVWKCLKEIHP